MRFRAALVLALLPAFAWSQDADVDIAVRVYRDGKVVVVEVDCPVDAPRAIVWDVLTDYEHMPRYITNLDYSVVDQRVDNLLRVHQKGKASRGPFTLAFENVREVELVPFTELRSRFVSGDLDKSTYVTRLVEIDHRLHIVNNGRYRTDRWIPPFIGPVLIEGGIRRQFGEIRAEILRRSALAHPPA